MGSHLDNEPHSMRPNQQAAQQAYMYNQSMYNDGPGVDLDGNLARATGNLNAMSFPTVSETYGRMAPFNNTLSPQGTHYGGGITTEEPAASFETVRSWGYVEASHLSALVGGASAHPFYGEALMHGQSHAPSQPQTGVNPHTRLSSASGETSSAQFFDSPDFLLEQPQFEEILRTISADWKESSPEYGSEMVSPRDLLREPAAQKGFSLSTSNRTPTFTAQPIYSAGSLEQPAHQDHQNKVTSSLHNSGHVPADVLACINKEFLDPQLGNVEGIDEHGQFIIQPFGSQFHLDNTSPNPGFSEDPAHTSGNLNYQTLGLSAQRGPNLSDLRTAPTFSEHPDDTSEQPDLQQGGQHNGNHSEVSADLSGNSTEQDPQALELLAGMSFTSREKAIAACPGPDWSPADPVETLPTMLERQENVRKLFVAMRNTNDIQDKETNKTLIRRWLGVNGPTGAKPFYNARHMEKVCWDIESLAFKIHTDGPSSLPIYDPAYLKEVKKTSGWRYEHRISKLISLLYNFKSRCDKLMKGSDLMLYVANPDEIIGTSLGNLPSNEKRQDLLKDGRIVAKYKSDGIDAAAEAVTPAPKAPRSKRILSTPNVGTLSVVPAGVGAQDGVTPAVSAPGADLPVVAPNLAPKPKRRGRPKKSTLESTVAQVSKQCNRKSLEVEDKLELSHDEVDSPKHSPVDQFAASFNNILNTSSMSSLSRLQTANPLSLDHVGASANAMSDGLLPSSLNGSTPTNPGVLHPPTQQNEHAPNILQASLIPSVCKRKSSEDLEDSVDNGPNPKRARADTATPTRSLSGTTTSSNTNSGRIIRQACGRKM